MAFEVSFDEMHNLDGHLKTTIDGKEVVALLSNNGTFEINRSFLKLQIDIPVGKNVPKVVISILVILLQLKNCTGHC